MEKLVEALIKSPSKMTPELSKFLPEDAAKKIDSKKRKVYFDLGNEDVDCKSDLKDYIQSGDSMSVRYLVSNGDIIPNDSVSLALKNGYPDIAKYLISRGARYSKSALSVHPELEEFAGDLKALSKSGNLEAVFKMMSRDILKAIKNADLGRIKKMIERDCAFIPDSAVAYAAELGEVEILEYLVANGGEQSGTCARLQ